MGSGTTAVSCSILGVNYTGVEINQEYIDIAEKRIRDLNS
jgi:DNA modification methylase